MLFFKIIRSSRSLTVAFCFSVFILGDIISDFLFFPEDFSLKSLIFTGIGGIILGFLMFEFIKRKELLTKKESNNH